MSNTKIDYSDIFNRNAIHSDAVSEPISKKHKYSLHLKEEENTGKNGLENVILEGFDNIFLVLKYDKCRFLDKTPEKLLVAEHIRKSCDYIVWATFQGKPITFIIEIKSKNNQDSIQKFKSTNAFIMYLKAIAYEYRFENLAFLCKDFKVIPLLINEKQPNNRRKIEPCAENDFTFYHLGVKNDNPYYIQRDFEQILEYENL